MLLCDIGNSRYHFKEGERRWDVEVQESPLVEGRLFYCSVNESARLKLCALSRVEAVDAGGCWREMLASSYHGLGEDRAVAMIGAGTGIVVDAGSAITVDIVRDGHHEGGFIVAGLAAQRRVLAQISPRLATEPLYELSALPQQTEQALGYGMLAPLCAWIEAHRGDLPVYLSGGDAEAFARIEGAVLRPRLVFEGIEKIIDYKGWKC